MSSGDLTWLMGRFVSQVPSVREAVVVSSDGLPLVASAGIAREDGERLAAVASGLIGLAYGSAGRFGMGAVTNVIIEMEKGWLFVTGIRDGSVMCVVTGPDADIGMIGYEMAVFAHRAGDVLTPEVRDTLKSALLGSA